MRLPPLRGVVLPILLVPLAGLLFPGLGRDPRQIPSPLVGKPLPVLAGATLTGESFSSTSLLGTPFIVNAWASWGIPACLAVELGVTGPPETFFVNADGIVIAKQIGPLTFETMAEYLADLGLSESAGLPR